MIKKLIAVMMLIGMISIPFCADTNEPVELKLKTQTEWTILDNASPATFYDLSSGQWYAGATTTLYKKYYTALQIGAIKNLHKDEKALFLGGVNLMIGELLGQVEFIKNIENTFLPENKILKSLTLGFWGAKDFTLNVCRYGFYTGVEIKL